MNSNKKAIKIILEKIEKAVDKKMKEWDEVSTELEDSFGKVTDGGSPDMKDTKGKFSKVSQDKAAKKMETEPTISKVAKTPGKGGATGVKGDGKAKEVKLEMSTNRKKLTGSNPAINEEDEVEENDMMEESCEAVEGKLEESKRLQIKKLREAIEKVTGCKVAYQKKKLVKEEISNGQRLIQPYIYFAKKVQEQGLITNLKVIRNNEYLYFEDNSGQDYILAACDDPFVSFKKGGDNHWTKMSIDEFQKFLSSLQ